MEKEQTEVKAGHGHTVEVVIDGKKRTIPWGFTNAKKEASAASKHKVETPGTTEGEPE